MPIGSCLFLTLVYTNSHRIVIGELNNYEGYTHKIGVSVLVEAAVSRFELPWQMFAKSDSCPFSCREIYALSGKRRFQFFFGVFTSQ